MSKRAKVRGMLTKSTHSARGMWKALREPKVFCISIQRTATTSVGRFFADHGHRVATWDVSRCNAWTDAWHRGDYEAIFRSTAFRTHQVFEDDPWWCGTFYRVLFHRFPDARFVLLERDASRWFESMRRHSAGRSLGNAYRHAELFRREHDLRSVPNAAVTPFTSHIDHALTIEEKHRSHYQAWYEQRHRAVHEFFDAHGPSRLVTRRLESAGLWQSLGAAFGFAVAADYDVHANAQRVSSSAAARGGP